MKIDLREDDKKLYARLHISGIDLGLAQSCLGVIIKKRWHHQPWERRAGIYLQQSVYTTAFVVAYVRPFTNSKGWPQFPSELKTFNQREIELHGLMVSFRNKIYAHSDSENYSVEPWRSGDFSTDVVKAPALRISSEHAALLNEMINKLQVNIRRKMSELTQDANPALPHLPRGL